MTQYLLWPFFMLKEANQKRQLQIVNINLILLIRTLKTIFTPKTRKMSGSSMAPFNFSGRCKSMIWKRNMHDQCKSIIRRIVFQIKIVMRVGQKGPEKF